MSVPTKVTTAVPNPNSGGEILPGRLAKSGCRGAFTGLFDLRHLTLR